MSPGEARRIAREYMLVGYEDKRYNELSSGYKKRVQAAIAFNRNPRILLLDEPFINVDSDYIGFLEQRILEEAREKLVVVATHVPTRLVEHDLILMREGRILYHGRIPHALERMITISVDGERKTLDEILRQCGVRGEIAISPLQEALFKLAGEEAL